MARFRAEFEVEAPPEEVRAYLRDPVNRVEWDPSVRSIGATTMTVGFYGRAVELDYRLVGDQPARLVFAPRSLLAHAPLRGATMSAHGGRRHRVGQVD